VYSSRKEGGWLIGLSWPETIVLLAIFGGSLAAAGHALLYKRDPRAALGWIGVSLLVPVLGAAFYFMFGINRIRTRARKLMARQPGLIDAEGGAPEALSSPDARADGLSAEFAQLARLSTAVTGRPLVRGNEIELLRNGEESYPAMLEAIDGARGSVFFSTYIFRTDRTGHRFIDAMDRARQRGVDVRVIVDGIGQMYTLPLASTLMRRRDVPVATFLPLRLIPPAIHVNLRNHRKILVVDGVVGFTGGINVGDNHLADDLSSPRRVADVHFRLAGPIVAQIETVFLEDWAFVTGRQDPAPASSANAAGSAACRAITDGPNEDLGKLLTVLIGAVASAHRSIRVMTPYFLPPRELIAALQAAALRGVQVSIVLPGTTDHPIVHWASRNMLWEILCHGVRVFYQPPPFVHSKLFVVDDLYAQIGSANLDPRSLRLNFELTVEVFDAGVALAISRHVDDAITRSREVAIDEVDRRPIAARTRDALAWLFSPYL